MATPPLYWRQRGALVQSGVTCLPGYRGSRAGRDDAGGPVKIGLKGSPTRVAKSFTKGAKAMGQLYEVDAEEAAEIIVQKLREKFII